MSTARDAEGPRGGAAEEDGPDPPGASKGPVPPSEWETWDDERLLGLRLCDLGVRLDGTEMEQRIAQVDAELRERGLEFQPHHWLSDEWFTPDGIPGIAVPFYLAHPRLEKLELAQMLEVEGGEREWCLRILRHETGHAIENAFHLRRRRTRQRLFGRSSEPYPDSYEPKPYSRSFVIHLESWYAQSHPDEDFAETFAVWLAPGSDWPRRYAGWAALKKIEYVDVLMRKLRGRAPLVTTRAQVDPLSRLRKTLRTHYRRKRARYALDLQGYYDRDLKRLFSDAPELRDRPTAAAFLTRVRREVRRLVRRYSGVYQYTIDQVLEELIQRARALNLRLRLSEEQTKAEIAVLLAVHTLNAVHSGRHRLAL